MPVFITLETDAFADTFNSAVNDKQAVQRAGITRARRPLRGLEIKDDTYAFMKLVRSDGEEILLVDSGSPDGRNTQFSNFILQSVSEARMEKHQIVETFGDPYIFFFGESPRFLDIQAVLVDSLDFNWYAEFWENYNLYLRGTRSVELNARTYLFYDDNVVEGYVLMAQAQKISDQPLMARLTFRMYITNYHNVTFVGDPNFPTRASMNLPPTVDLTTADAFTAGLIGLSAAVDAAEQESRAIQAAVGASQQASGFGGGSKLSDSLRGGLTSTGDIFTDGILLNALEALGGTEGVGARIAPLRGKISDNVDEFTAFLPAAPVEDTGQEDHDGQAEAYDVPSSAIANSKKYGANVNDPGILARLGLGVRFTASAGFGVGASLGFSASFGVGASAGFGASFGGGINGGLGFTGGFTASASASLSFGASAGLGVTGNATTSLTAGQAQLAQLNISRQFGAGVYGNGIVINGGIIQGTGVGGGVPGGVSAGIGPDGTPLTQFTGGKGYGSINGFASGQGYSGQGANGASISVGGAPSAFSTVAAPGVLDPAGTATANVFIGPDGVSSNTNTTGIFA